MTLPNAYLLANDSEFRLLTGYSYPPRPGRIKAIEATGQVRVELDDPDGGDALAWPLNGFTYGVDDLVYVLFAANSPDSAIVVGARALAPVRFETSALRARNANGLRLEDDAGSLGILIADGGRVGVRTTNPTADLQIGDGSAAADVLISHIDGTDGRLMFRDNTGRGFTLVDDAANNQLLLQSTNGTTTFTHITFPRDTTTTLFGNFGGWTALPLTNSGGTTWANYGFDWQTARYRKIGDIVYLEGLVKRTAGTGNVIATLPTGFRPTGNMLYVTSSLESHAHLHVLTTGAVEYRGGGDVSQWISLAGICFSTL